MFVDKNNLINIKEGLSNKGYYIYKNLIDKKLFQNIQSFWVRYFNNQNKSNLQEVVWQPYLGEKNKRTFSEDKNQCLYRIYDFYWNKSIHQETKKLVYELGDFVNKNLLNSKLFTNQINEHNFGLYCSVSHYPINKGYLFPHKDKISENNKLYHHILPLTFKSKHFESGGLYIYDRNNNKINIEDLIEEGDVIFYDGSLKHGVEVIKGNDQLNIGRIQTFSIPVKFKYPAENIRTLIDLNLNNKTLLKYLFYRFKKFL